MFPASYFNNSYYPGNYFDKTGRDSSGGGGGGASNVRQQLLALMNIGCALLALFLT